MSQNPMPIDTSVVRERTLGIVIPCYNEEEVLPETARRMTELIGRLVSAGKISPESRMVFVDDGSRDRTWQIIEDLAAASRHVSGIKLSRNRSHQNALIAGLFTCPGDMLVSIDADLQDDINVIAEMVDLYLAGTDIVYGVRKGRETDTVFKRLTALGFYRMMNVLGANSIYNHADYRLMSRRAVEALKEYREVNLYLRGIVPLIGYRQAIVRYDRGSRFAGESKYPLRRMLGLALDAITSFSIVPLRIITFTGFVVSIASLFVTVWALWVRFFTQDAVPGWTSIVLPMYFLGGIQIFCIGMLGEYLGKVYSEVKSRPRYVIEKVIGH
jgi:glycosyltransferase involved in cell wall biosynthesis